MIRHTLLPAPITNKPPAAHTTPRTRPTTASLLITDPDTVTYNRPTTVGRAQWSLRQ